MKQSIAVILLSSFLVNNIFSQNQEPAVNPDSISYNRIAIVSAATAGFVTAVHIQSYNSWWKGERSDFQIHDEGAYAIGADKLGHLYFSYASSDILGRSLCWTGISEKQAFLYGASVSLAFELYVEIEDGFTKNLGFSPGDAISDATGAFLPYFRYVYPSLNYFDYKISLFPSVMYRNGIYRTIIDDYESIYYWISFDRNLFPQILNSVIPKFFTVAAGYSVKQITVSGKGFPEIFLSLDYDFEKLPGEGSFLRSIKHVLNYIHFPAPGIRVTPSVIFYGLKF
jgi:hypothetical protein